MGDLSLRMKAVADLTAVTDWTKHIDEARTALEKYTSAIERHNTVAGAPSGAPGAPATAGDGPPPASPPPPPAGAPQSRWETDPTVMMVRNNPAAQPGAWTPPPPRGPIPSDVDEAEAFTNSEGAGDAARAGRRTPLGPSPWETMQGSRATRQSWGVGVASAAAGFVVGGSLVGILTSSAEVFMRNDKILTQMRRNFRDASGDVADFARSYTYSVQEAAQAGKAIGAQLDIPSRADASRLIGFGRWSGMDQGEVASTWGRVQRLSGGAFGDDKMAGLMGVAKMLGMANGRLPEFMQQITGMAEQQFDTRGRVDTSSLAGLALFPGMVFGADDPRSQGMEAAAFMGRLNQGFQTPSTSTFLMRLMGYGKKDGPGYWAMRERTEAGATDPRNIADVLKYVGDLGFNDTARGQAIEGALPTLKVHEIRALTDLTGNADKMALMEKYLTGGDNEGLRRFLAENGTTSFAELGQGRASIGEAVGTQWENMQMTVGEPIAKALLTLREAMESGIKTFTNLTGIDWEDVAGNIEKGAKAVKQMADEVEHFTRGGAAETARKSAAAYVDHSVETVNALVGAGVQAGQALVNGVTSPEAGGGQK